MSVSVSTPRGTTPSIHSVIETIPSQPAAEPIPIPPSLGPSHILTHDVNRLLSYIHDVDQSRTLEHRELADNIRAIREELLDINGKLDRPEAPPTPAPAPAPAPVIVQIPAREATPVPAPPPAPAPVFVPVLTPAPPPARPTQIIIQPQYPPPVVVQPQAPPPVVYRDVSVAARSEVSVVPESRPASRTPSLVAPSPSPVRELLVESPEPMSEPSPSPPPPRPSSVHDVPRTPQRRAASPPQRPEQPRLIPISLSPPPLRRMASPDSLSDAMSFLSSHHSDDLSLLESEEYPIRAASPSWPSYSSSSSSPISSPSSSSISVPALEPREVSSVSSESIEAYSPEPPQFTAPSPVPSSVSSVTARPIPPINFSHLQELVERLGDQMLTLEDGQNHTHQVLEDLRSRSTTVIHDSETFEKIRHMEEMLHRLLAQQSAPAPIITPAPIYVPAPAPPPAPELEPEPELPYVPEPEPTIAPEPTVEFEEGPIPVPPPMPAMPVPPPDLQIAMPIPEPAAPSTLLSDQAPSPRITMPAPPPPVLAESSLRPEDETETVSSSSGASSLTRRIARFREELVGIRDQAPIHMPTPVRPAGRSFDEQLAELLTIETPPVQAAAQPPPPIVPLVYRPGPRAPRPRSVSPTIDTPRPRTVPIVSPVPFEGRRPTLRPRPSRQRVPPRRTEGDVAFPQPAVEPQLESARTPPRSEGGQSDLSGYFGDRGRTPAEPEREPARSGVSFLHSGVSGMY